ncbi:M42 family metallopeptidase [Paenibacillus donghaensis]|uniref:M42 family metallopeptidase n=1 Tax=Paenibacillus donghaensis TaxID=414771 RepID=UPI00188488C2|nr:M42 family metallopeptidase [Paenibacillus donghaensis]MBE9913110.1 M42 family metallopeptidase [Paenibacillus donghaensis]
MEQKLEKMKNRLRELTSLPAVSGYEDPVIRYVRAQFKDCAQEVHVDALGNVTVKMNRSAVPEPYRVMVFAHMDELGLMVNKIEESGFLRVERLGGIPEKSLAGQSVIIEAGGKTWNGVIGTKSHHVTPSDEKYRVLPVSEVFADFGFNSRQEAEMAGIDVGTPIMYQRQFFTNGSRVFSNALDNRAGCLALLELADLVKDKELSCELYLVFSVQEEFNLRGVLPAVRRINPHLAITLDITIATDTPDLLNKGNIYLGGGPSIGMYTFHGRGTLGGLIPNPKLVQHIKKIAAAHHIPLQPAVFMGILTDASFSQLENEGLPMVDLGYPARYTHAPVESVDLEDVHKLVLLLERLVYTFDGSIDFSRG